MVISSYSAIIGLSEAAGGYSGGSATDYYPGLELTEATGAFSNFLVNWGIENEAANQAYNTKIVGVMVESARYHTPIDESAILDEAVGGIVDKVKKFFNKIKEWIKSIIAKLRMFIDKIVMSGERLVSKYEETVKNKNLKGMTFTGYKFCKDIAGAFSANINKIQNDTTLNGAINVAITGTAGTTIKTVDDFRTAYSKQREKGDPADQAKAEIKKLTDTDSSKKYDNLMKFATGLSKGESWKTALNKYLYGGDGKTELKYSDSAGYGTGDASFGKNAVIKALKEPEQFSDIQEAYEALEDMVKKNEETLTDHVNKINDELEADRDYSGGDADKEKQGKHLGAISIASYATAYLGVIDTVYTVMHDVRDAQVNAVKARNAQAKAIFSKMLSYKEASSNSDFSDSYVEEFGLDGFGESF